MPLMDKLKSIFHSSSHQKHNEDVGPKTETQTKTGHEEERSTDNRDGTHDRLSEAAAPQPAEPEQPRRASLEERLMESQRD